MEDVRALVPRVPPDGLIDWAVNLGCADAHAMLYSVEWVEDHSLEAILDECSRGRKEKAVRAKCSACGRDDLYPWVPADRAGGSYGFWLPNLGQPVSSGDRTYCPFCGAPVIVKKRSDLGRGYVVTSEDGVMSASVVGPNHYLALTGWMVERRVYRDASEDLVARPTEAYVFGPASQCAKLTGWCKSYSGTAGYFMAYKRCWGQPQQWSETWGDLGGNPVYGMTPELVARSCLPNSKLDLYLHRFSDEDAKFPVAYLRLYQEHPAVENLVVSGLPMVLDDLLLEQMSAVNWEGNRRGLPVLPDLDWSDARPAQILGLTKDELRRARGQCWGAFLWRLYQSAKRHGEILTERDMVNAWEIGDEDLLDVVGRGPVAKTMRYLLRQYELAGPGAEDEYGDPIPGLVLDVSFLLDYWRMVALLGNDLENDQVRFPDDLCQAHDELTVAVGKCKAKSQRSAFKRRRAELARYSFEADGLLIRPAGSQDDLIREGAALHHCIRTYGEDHASGRTAIFFIRHSIEPDKSYFTLEFDEARLQVLQNRGLRNCERTSEVTAFEALWLDWVRSGCQRTEDGSPILPKANKAKLA